MGEKGGRIVMRMKNVCGRRWRMQESYDSWLRSKELIRVKDLKTGLDLHCDLRCSLGKEEPRYWVVKIILVKEVNSRAGVLKALSTWALMWLGW